MGNRYLTLKREKFAEDIYPLTYFKIWFFLQKIIKMDAKKLKITLCTSFPDSFKSPFILSSRLEKSSFWVFFPKQNLFSF